jgi:hypothetical protein
MIKIKQYLPILVFIFSTNSCDKLFNDDFTASEKLIVGEPLRNKYYLNSLDSALIIRAPGNDPSGEIYSLDIDKDSIIDFKLASYSEKMLPHAARLYCTNDSIKILIRQVKDTIIFCSEHKNPAIPDNPFIKYNTLSNFIAYCEKDSIEDIVFRHYPVQFNHGDTLVFNAPENSWSKYATFSHQYKNPFLGDTYDHIVYGDWNGIAYKYLCFKMEDGERTRYGWLKLKIRYSFEITLIEYAIQK